MRHGRALDRKIQNSFRANFEIIFYFYFFFSPSVPRLFFDLVPTSSRGCRRRETFPLGYEFEEESSDVEPVAYRSNYAFQLHANMASCRHSFCAYLHTPPRCYPLSSPSKSYALYAFRKTARTCLEKYAVSGISFDFHSWHLKYPWKILEIVCELGKKKRSLILFISMLLNSIIKSSLGEFYIQIF